MPESIVHVGADVAKDSIVWDFNGECVSLANSMAGCVKGFAHLAKLGATVHIVCEPTGGYERTLLRAAAKHHRGVCLVNAWRVRQHAKASGILAKTDRIDARVLSTYGRVHQPAVRVEPSAEQRLLSDLILRRGQVQDVRQAELNRLAMAENLIIRTSIQRIIRALDRQLEFIDKELRALVKSNAQWTDQIDRFCQVRCVGWLTACSLVALMPELGKLDDQQAAALAGVAPFNVDSGQFKGQRRVQGGRPAVRKALYMAALAGIRYNPVFKVIYQRLRQKGKPGKVALTAIMRKLIILLNRMTKNPDFTLAQ